MEPAGGGGRRFNLDEAAHDRSPRLIRSGRDCVADASAAVETARSRRERRTPFLLTPQDVCRTADTGAEWWAAPAPLCPQTWARAMAQLMQWKVAEVPRERRG